MAEQTIVAQLPNATQNKNKEFLVMDSLTPGDCTVGGGTNHTLCISNGSAWVPLETFGTAAAANIGSQTGQIPVVPVPMASMSTPVKSTIDGITAAGSDSAAYHPASAFATAAQGVNARTPTAHSHAESDVTNLAADLALKADKLGIVRERRLLILKSNVNMNALLQDVAVFTGLPSLYCVEGLRVFSPSVSLATVAKLGMFTGALGTGTTVITSALISAALNAWSDMTIVAGVRNATVSYPSLYVQNTVPLGLAVSCSLLLTILDLSP